MWFYLALRIFLLSILVPTLSRLMRRLDEVENARGGGLQVQKARNWELLPATLFTTYFAFASFIIP
jgi:hypothetical protein